MAQRVHKSRLLQRMIDDLIVEARLDILNSAEKLIFQRIMEGATDEELGKEFYITKEGVEHHKQNILNKVLGRKA